VRLCGGLGYNVILEMGFGGLSTFWFIVEVDQNPMHGKKVMYNHAEK
jgi:hypothetical protein